MEGFFSIKGKAAYGNGITVFDAEVTLLDTNEKAQSTLNAHLDKFGVRAPPSITVLIQEGGYKKIKRRTLPRTFLTKA